MSTIIIQADSSSNKILSDLAKKLGGQVLSIKDEQYEDFVLGSLMDKAKTTETVSRDEIFKTLRKK